MRRLPVPACHQCGYSVTRRSFTSHTTDHLVAVGYLAWLADVSANHTVRCQVDGFVGSLLPPHSRIWKRRPGLPRNRRLDQLREGSLSKKRVTRFVTAMALDRRDERIVDSLAELGNVVR